MHDDAVYPRDAASYAHIGNKSRLDRPGRRVVAAQELHLLLVGADRRRDLLAEGGHGSFGRRGAWCCQRVLLAVGLEMLRRGDVEQTGAS